MLWLGEVIINAKATLAFQMLFFSLFNWNKQTSDNHLSSISSEWIQNGPHCSTAIETWDTFPPPSFLPFPVMPRCRAYNDNRGFSDVAEAPQIRRLNNEPGLSWYLLRGPGLVRSHILHGRFNHSSAQSLTYGFLAHSCPRDPLRHRRRMKTRFISVFYTTVKHIWVIWLPGNIFLVEVDVIGGRFIWWQAIPNATANTKQSGLIVSSGCQLIKINGDSIYLQATSKLWTINIHFLVA